MAKTTRRRLILFASGALFALAGCGGNQEDGTDGSVDGNGDGGSDDGENGTPSDDGQGDGTAPMLGDATAFSESYAMAATQTVDGQTMEMSGRFYQGDMYWEIDQQGQRMEWYLVDDTSYVIVDGQCYRGMMQQGMSRDDADPSRFSERASAHPDVEPVGRDTIDGETVLVYEISADEADSTGETVRYYVLEDSGHLRRIESDSMRWDFHSWGSVDPIRAPNGNCQEMPGSGMMTTSNE